MTMVSAETCSERNDSSDCFPFVVKLGAGRHRAAAAVGVSLMLCFAYYVFYIVMVAVVSPALTSPETSMMVLS